MKHQDKPKSLADIQLDQLIRELDTPEGMKRLAEDARKEVKEAEKRKSIKPTKR